MKRPGAGFIGQNMQYIVEESSALLSLTWRRFVLRRILRVVLQRVEPDQALLKELARSGKARPGQRESLKALRAHGWVFPALTQPAIFGVSLW